MPETAQAPLSQDPRPRKALAKRAAKREAGAARLRAPAASLAPGRAGHSSENKPPAVEYVPATPQALEALPGIKSPPRLRGVKGATMPPP